MTPDPCPQPGAGRVPTTCAGTTPGLLPAGGQGPGTRVCEPGWADVPDQSGGRGGSELPELHPPWSVLWSRGWRRAGGVPVAGWRRLLLGVATIPSPCLAALSQIMLFVDGMLGVINHNETVQWLYTLSGSLVSSSVPLSVAVPWGVHPTPRLRDGFGAILPSGSLGAAHRSHPVSPDRCDHAPGHRG